MSCEAEKNFQVANYQKQILINDDEGKIKIFLFSVYKNIIKLLSLTRWSMNMQQKFSECDRQL